MKLLPLLFVCLVSRSEGTCPAGNGPTDPRAVKEGDDVVLRCSFSSMKDISTDLFDWKKVGPQTTDQLEVFQYENGKHYNNNDDPYSQSEQFRGRVFHFPEELKHGNASIIIRNTKVADSGNYTCDFPRLQTGKKVTIELVVGAAPKPSVKSLDATKDSSLLQCEVLRSSPKPRVEWQDSSGNILPADDPQVSESGGSYDIILKTKVTKSDLYYCVATQETINHQTCADTYVHIGSNGVYMSSPDLSDSDHRNQSGTGMFKLTNLEKS